MAEDDLRINTLHRFAKRSPKLILHEYSHCEVPAGCGGVVLSWIDPEQGRPVTCHVGAPRARGEMWLDGAPLTTSLSRLRTGRRLIALHMVPQDSGSQVFSLTVSYDDRDTDLVSSGTPTWRCTRVRPDDSWIDPGFDDSAWTAPVVATPRTSARDSWVAHLFERARERGQPVFELEHELWLRVTFTVEEPR